MLALASGPEAFATVEAVKDSPLGVLVLFGYTLVVFYHMGNGVRHLVWDRGLRLRHPRSPPIPGLAVLAFAGAMTILVWLVISSP